MALKDKVQAAEAAQAEAKAPAAPTTPATSNAQSSRTEAFKAKGAAIRAQMTEDQKAAEGSKSDKVAFVCVLGDATQKQGRVEKGQNLPSFAVVGYKFKALEDMTVPYAPIRPDFKTTLDVMEPTEQKVKAGETFAMNNAEMAMLISRVEYAGRFSGEGKTVTLSVKMSNNREAPLPILTMPGGGSIKENMELICDMVGGDGTSKNRGTPKIKPEYEAKFGALYARRLIRRTTAGTAKKEGEGQANLAAAFRAYYNRK